MENKNTIDKLSQWLIPTFTLGGQLAIALKYPLIGLVINLLAQPFWIYSSWRGYKDAKQIGLFITTIIMTIIIIGGIINYLFL